MSQTPRVVIVDYKMGNLQSVANAFRFLGCEASIVDNPSDLASEMKNSGPNGPVKGLVLPGVGAFGMAMQNLRSQGMIEPLNEWVLDRKFPLLGICLGMQLLADRSDELGNHEGLGWIPGHVKKLDPKNDLRIPHVGWNTATIVKQDPLFQKSDPKPCYYFVHSFHFECAPENVAATCDYGTPFVAAVQKDSIFATQFHPEKSQTHGLRILRNFLNFAEGKVGRG
ncbi:MAG: imidazole glycerol phosphate synthase subunit HisH [Bdellovibrionales bacterium]|nr:imidazole glycerol phosphate synthase subunit HisH [Bdellovibrionales bacterium]